MDAGQVARIDRYVLAQLLAVFGFFALVLVLVYWVNRAVVLFDQLIGDGQSVTTFLVFSALTLPGLIRIVLPIAAFAAAVYVSNRMITDRELVILQATGASALRLARPLAIFGLISFVLMSVLVHVLVPLSSAEFAKRQAELAQNATARLLQDGQFLSPVDGVTFYVREITNDGEMRNIFLADTRAGTSSQTFTAATAYLIRGDAGPQLVMIDGLVQSLDRETGRLATTSFDELAYDIGALAQLPDPTVPRLRDIPTSQLWRASTDMLALLDVERTRLRALIHDRIAQSLLPIVGALLGFAALLIGQFSRFGLWRQIVSAILFIIFLKGLESWAAARTAVDPAQWPTLYLQFVTGIGVCAILLALANGAIRRRRRPAE